MTRRLIYLIAGVLTLAFHCKAAASPSATTNTDSVAAKIMRSAAMIETMTCRFVQTKHLSLLADKMVSQGTLTYESPGKLRWQYNSPYKYIFVTDGNKVTIGAPDRHNTFDARSNKLFAEVARLISGTVTGDITSSKSDFSIDIESHPDKAIVTLTPRRRELKSLMTSIVLTFNPDKGVVSHITINERNGDRCEIQLTDIVFNKPVNESIFSVN